MKVSKFIKDALVAGTKEELDTATKELDRATKVFAEKKAAYDWAKNLTLGNEIKYKWGNKNLTPFRIRKLYFVPSKSGRRYGHYIEVFEDGVRCTCPGFLNRGYCHASRSIQEGKGTFGYIWLLTHSEFDSQRDRALDYYE